MHILVCVKQVPDTTEIKLNPETNSLDRSSAPTIMNPYDAHAVEEAVLLKEKCGGKVSVITMGPQKAQEIVKKCISMGADEGYLLSDRAFAGSDTLATSYILSMGIRKIMEKEPVDMILCGKQAIDGDTAQVGPGIASRFDMPQLTCVEYIKSIYMDDSEIIVNRKMDNGYEVVKSKLPCLLTIEKNINKLRHPEFTHIIRSSRYSAVVWGKDDIQADLEQVGLKGSPTAVRRIFPPYRKLGGEVIQGSSDEVVKILVSKLKGGIS